MTQAFLNANIHVVPVTFSEMEFLSTLMRFFQRALNWMSIMWIFEGLQCHAVRMLFAMPLLPLAALVLLFVSMNLDPLISSINLSTEVDFGYDRIPKVVFDFQKMTAEATRGVQRVLVQQVLVAGTLSFTHLLDARAWEPRDLECPYSEPIAFFGIFEMPP